MGSMQPLVLVGVALLCLGDLLHIIGISTTYWTEAGSVHSGLFEACGGDICLDISDDDSDFQAVRAMVIIGLIAGLASAGLALVFTVMKLLSKEAHNSLVAMVATGSAVVAFVFIMIGVIVYGAKIYDDTMKAVPDLGYSFGLPIAGAILLLLGSMVFYMGSKK